MSTTAVVVDTNVAVVANDASRTDPDWPASCVLAAGAVVEFVCPDLIAELHEKKMG